MRQNDMGAARRELERALSLDSSYHEAGISLVSLLLEAGEVKAARELLERVQRMPSVRPALLSTIMARVALAEGGLRVGSQACPCGSRPRAGGREPAARSSH